MNPEASYLLWTDRRGRELALLATGAAVALGLVAVGIARPSYLGGTGAGYTLALFGLTWLAFVAGVLLVGRLPVRWAVPLIGLGGLALPLAAFVNRPAVPYLPFQLTAMGFALATTVLLLVGLRRLGLDPRRAVWWAWCPTVAIEAGSVAHIDVVAAFLTALGFLLLARAPGRRAVAWGGAVLGLAAMGAAVGAVYLPHPRFALVTWLVPPRALLLVVLVALGGRAVWLTVVAAAYLVQYASDLHVSPPVAQRWSYGVAGLVVLGSWLWERRRRRRATRGNPQNSRAGPRTCGPASDDALVG